MINYNIDAEKSVLCAIMLDNLILSDLDINENDFCDGATKCTFKTMLSLYNNGSNIDTITVADALSKSGKLDAVGGVLFLTDIAGYTPTAANVKYHAKILRQLSLRRKLKRYAEEISFKAGDCEDVESLVDEAQKKLLDITENDSSKGATLIGNISKQFAEELIENQGKPEIGISTKFSSLDGIIGGFKPGNLIVLAARPAMGKTALALNFAHGVARTMPVLFVSLEMSEKQLLDRLFKAEAYNMMRWDLGTGEAFKHNITAIERSISYLKLHIYDSSVASVGNIRRAAQKIKHMYGGLGLIIIDYLQLMRIEGRHDSRVQEVSELTRSLKILARELEVPIIALSQLSRSVESRNDKRPLLSDLRESGSIEQDADIVMMLYRDSYYNESSNNPGYTELIVNKNRAGPVGKVDLLYRFEFLRFIALEGPKQLPKKTEEDSDGKDNDGELD